MRKWAAFIALFLADRLSKEWLFSALPRHVKWQLIPGLSLFCCENKGMAWGVGSTHPVFVVLLGTLLLILFGYQLLKKPSWTMILIVAGGLGNMMDRVLYGGVRDFILLSYDKFSWPIFNFADIYLTIGGLLILLEIIFPLKNISLILKPSAKDLTR